MQAIDIRNPNERKKLIIAGALGLLAIILLWWAFFGFGAKTTPVATQRTPARPTANTQRPTQPTEVPDDVTARLQPINYEYSAPLVAEARRNIFVYYEPPPVVVVEKPVPTPTPTPTPPVLLAGVNPGSVFARTADFTLEVTGDKFTSQLKVLVDNNPLPTRYVGPQQMSATVPAAMIATPGTRQVMLRSQDGSLYSNGASFNVAAPPTPNYSYIGILGSPRYIDTAILQDKTSKDMLNAQRGDLVGGRFRVISISEKELVLIDTNLKIKHSLAFTASNDRNNPLQRPAPRVESEDDEP
jgi:hypothetical protein